MNSLLVFRIDDPSAEINFWEAFDDDNKYLKVDNPARTRKIGGMKDDVANAWGVPAERQRYYGFSRYPNVCFHATEILGDNNDDGLLSGALKDAHNRGLSRCEHLIGVFLLPPEAIAPGRNGGDDVRLVREVDTIAERIAAGRDSAVQIDDDHSDLEDDEEEESRPPRPKRQRRTKNEDDAEDGTANNNGGREEEEANDPVAENGNGGDEEVAQVRARGGDDADVLAEQVHAADAENAAEGENDENPVQVEAGAEEGGNAVGNIAAGAVNDDAGEAVAEGDAPQSVRQWLHSLGVNGANAGRFEEYAPAFEREFNSLRDVALAADNPMLGLGEILEACGVQRIGDKASIMWAIGKLPRPE